MSRSAAPSSPPPGGRGRAQWLVARRARWLPAFGIAAALHAALFLIAARLTLPMRPTPPSNPATNGEPVWLELIGDGEGSRVHERHPPPAPPLPAARPTHSPAVRARAEEGSSGAQPSTYEAMAAPVLPASRPEDMASAAPFAGGASASEPEPASTDGPANGEALAAPRLSLRELGVGAQNNPFLGPPAHVPSRRQVLEERLAHSLRSDLARQDQKLGLGPEGPAVAAVKSIVLDSATTPNTSALLRLRTDAEGRTVHVEVVEAANESDGWRRIAAELAQALAGKQLRVPPNTGGVSMLLRVASRVQLPSGADPGLEVQLFGQTLKAGEGDRSAKIEILTPPELVIQEVEIPHGDGRTMPMPMLSLAIVGARGDLSDIGGVAKRVVTAYLVKLETHPPTETAPGLAQP